MGWFSDNSDGVLKSTGTLQEAKLKNIYDLAGNAGEWTQRPYNGGRVAVGGAYNQAGWGQGFGRQYYYNYPSGSAEHCRI